MPSKKINSIKFYAVAAGRKTGIFMQWSQAQASTNKFRGACHKGFATLEGACTFLESYDIDMDTIEVIINDNDSMPYNEYINEGMKENTNKLIIDHHEQVDKVEKEEIEENMSHQHNEQVESGDSKELEMEESVVHHVIPTLPNSTADDKFSCTSCTTADHGYMIKCGDCSAWYHFECTELHCKKRRTHGTLKKTHAEHIIFMCSNVTDIEHVLNVF